MNELVPMLKETALEVASDPAEYMIAACERAKVWLLDVLERGDIESIVEVKSQAEAIRVYTMQKNLGKDAELAAAEIVRRAERGIGLAIRKGQEDGVIAVRGQGGGVPPNARDRSDKAISLPTEFASPSELSGNGSGLYQMTDNVTDDQFEEAIHDAKAEGNLSRANVVRKVRGEKPPERSEYHYKRRRIDIARVVEETLITLEGLAHGLALVNIDDATDEQRDEWAGRYNQAMRPIRQFFKEV